MDDIAVRLDRFRALCADQSFLSNKGLSNEVGLYIFAYNPGEEMTVRHFITGLKEQMNGREGGPRVKVFDLYDILLDICRERRILDRIPRWRSSAARTSCVIRSCVSRRLKRISAICAMMTAAMVISSSSAVSGGSIPICAHIISSITSSMFLRIFRLLCSIRGSTQTRASGFLRGSWMITITARLI